MKKLTWVQISYSFLVLYFSVGLFQQRAVADTITASVTGSVSLTPVDQAQLQNGLFLIERQSSVGHAAFLGDGEDEITTWSFDFTSDPSFLSFSTAQPLSSALLTLTLTPRPTPNTDGPPGITTDFVKIEGLSDIVTATIQGLSVDVTSTIEIDLLEFYTANQIIGTLTTGTPGEVPMLYNDDAVVSYASMVLQNEIPVKPEISVEDGFIKLDTTGGYLPMENDCIVSEHYGRMVLDEVNGNIYICAELGWLLK